MRGYRSEDIGNCGYRSGTSWIQIREGPGIDLSSTYMQYMHVNSNKEIVMVWNVYFVLFFTIYTIKLPFSIHHHTLLFIAFKMYYNALRCHYPISDTNCNNYKKKLQDLQNTRPCNLYKIRKYYYWAVWSQISLKP